MRSVRSVIFIVVLAVATGIPSCKKDEDASILTGTWRSTGDIQTKIEADSHETIRLIESEIERLCTPSELLFNGDGSFSMTYSDSEGKQTVQMGSGTYFRKDGKLYAQYTVSGPIGASVLYLTVTDGGLLEVYHDSTQYFRNNPAVTGETDGTPATASLVSITTVYARL